MLLIYRFCLLIGGVFVAISVFAGFDGVEFDNGFDADIEIRDNSDSNSTPEAEAVIAKKNRWFNLLKPPIFSFRFWTFGSCFFGLTGVLLSRIQPPMSQLLVAIISIAVGAIFGAVMVGVLRSLRQSPVDSLVRPADVVGLSGIVEIPFDSMNKGKVRVSVKGLIVDFVAFTTHTHSLSQGEQVFIVEMKGSKVWVLPESSLTNE
ncbi:NfeD-like protein [Lyngbya aestuarii]|uniref:NfeD-like protein n=1 Tax=Lyngbya aestuarii TaxID=118322 RepID=UPI00403DC374